MYESFASMTPFVTTPVGNVRDHDEFIHLAENPDVMSVLIRAFAEDPSSFVSRSKAAHNAFLREFSWEKITDAYEGMYYSLTGLSPR